MRASCFPGWAGLLAAAMFVLAGVGAKPVSYDSSCKECEVVIVHPRNLSRPLLSVAGLLIR